MTNPKVSEIRNQNVSYMATKTHKELYQDCSMSLDQIEWNKFEMKKQQMVELPFESNQPDNTLLDPALITGGTTKSKNSKMIDGLKAGFRDRVDRQAKNQSSNRYTDSSCLDGTEGGGTVPQSVFYPEASKSSQPRNQASKQQQYGKNLPNIAVENIETTLVNYDHSKDKKQAVQAGFTNSASLAKDSVETQAKKKARVELEEFVNINPLTDEAMIEDPNHYKIPLPMAKKRNQDMFIRTQ